MSSNLTAFIVFSAAVSNVLAMGISLEDCALKDGKGSFRVGISSGVICSGIISQGVSWKGLLYSTVVYPCQGTRFGAHGHEMHQPTQTCLVVETEG